MNSTYPLAVLFFWFLHWIAGTLWISAIILLIAWAIKNLAAEKLKSTAMWMLGIGLIVAVLTAPASIAGWRWFVGEMTGRTTMNMMRVDRDGMMQLQQRMRQYGPGRNDPQFENMRDMMEEMMRGEDLPTD